MKYILKKDLPYAKAGTEFTEISPIFNSGGKVKMYCSFNSPMIHNFSEKDIIELKDWFEPIAEKPPLGLKPIWVHHEERLQEIKDAIKRYDDAKKDVPAEWINEAQTLQAWIYGRNKDKEESSDKSPFKINKAFEILYTINGEEKSIKYAVTSVTHQNHLRTARLVSFLTPKALPNEELTEILIKYLDDNIK